MYRYKSATGTETLETILKTIYLLILHSAPSGALGPSNTNGRAVGPYQPFPIAAATIAAATIFCLTLILDILLNCIVHV